MVIFLAWQANKFTNPSNSFSGEERSYPRKKEFWQKPPRKMQYQTFKRILDYLEGSNKILMDNGEIVWTFPSNPKLEKLVHTGRKLR